MDESTWHQNHDEPNQPKNDQLYAALLARRALETLPTATKDNDTATPAVPSVEASLAMTAPSSSSSSPQWRRVDVASPETKLHRVDSNSTSSFRASPFSISTYVPPDSSGGGNCFTTNNGTTHSKSTGGISSKSTTRSRRSHIDDRSTSEAAPSPSFDNVANVLFSRPRQLLWTFWRRRQVVRLRTIFSAYLLRVRRHPLGARLLPIVGVLLSGVFWFLLIAAVAGPPVRNVRSAKTGGNGGSRDKAGHHSYYRRIVSEVGVGPSLSDPWVVREIELAAAEWGPGLDYGKVGGGLTGSRGSIGASGMRVPLDGGGASVGEEQSQWEWDGRVNTMVIGDLMPEGAIRRHTDLLLTIFSGTTEADLSKRELLRQIYDKHEGWVRVGGAHSITGSKNPERGEFAVAVVFVVSDEAAPPEGNLVGDVLYVPVPEGYHNIVLKTKAMLRLVQYYDFKYLLKGDDDSFVCLMRIASMLHDMDPLVRDKVYAGVPTSCNNPTNPDYWNGRVMKNPQHRWYDSKYVQHTLGSLNCFPVYMQGAFYILSQPLVEHLFRGHEHLECFTNEDVTIGSWLLGVDREMVEMYNLRDSHLWDCLCARKVFSIKARRYQQFFHNCKTTSELKLCGTRLLRPGVGC